MPLTIPPIHPESIRRFGHQDYLSRAVKCHEFWLAALALLVPQCSSAQQALQNLQAVTSFKQPQIEDYNIRSGDFRMRATPSLNIDYNDNININSSTPESDFIFRPLMNLDCSWPITDRNGLNVSAGVGYDIYVDHPDRDGLYLQNGSAISFDVGLKDFTFNFHDRFSYTQDSSQQSLVASTSNYGQWMNIVGVLGSWNMEDVVTSLGYDHLNNQSTSDQYQSQNHLSEMFSSRVGLRLLPVLTTGVEGTVALTSYDQNILNNNTAYTAGLFADWKPSNFIQIQPRFGWSLYDFQQTSSSIKTGNSSPWYADLTITHHVTDIISYSLSAGRQSSLGIQADLTESWYVRPTIKWMIIDKLSMTTFFSYELGDQGAGNQSGNLMESYTYMSAGISLDYPIYKKISTGLHYRITLRSSDEANRDYTQNLVGLQITYHF